MATTETTLQSKFSKVADIWQKSLSPLRNLSKNQIEAMLTNARLGNDVKLQQCFSLVEQSTPIFSICIDKRTSGLLSRAWDIVPAQSTPEAASQARAVKGMFEEADSRSEDSLSDALSWLALGAFRGRAVVKPFIEDGKLVFKKIDNWHVLRHNGKFYWNPQADDFPFEGSNESRLLEIPKQEIMYTLYDRPIDIPGITIYLMLLIGDTKWSQFVERCGIPQVILIPPEDTSEAALDEWTARAMQIYAGGSGTLPAGADIKELTSGRNQDPFSKYIDHQMEVISIMATGGTLLTLGGTVGMGSQLAEMQKKQFEVLINQDARKIQSTLSNVAVKKCCDALGQDVMCRFRFIEEDDVDARTHVELAKQLHEMGAAIDVQKLREVTGLPYISQDVQSVWTPAKESE